MIYSLCFGLFLVGLYGLLTKRNTMKIVISVIIMECAVNLFLIVLGYREGGVAPILTPGEQAVPERFVDPLPQALVLTSIVIGLGVVALMVALCVRLYERYGTFDVGRIRRLWG